MGHNPLHNQWDMHYTRQSVLTEEGYVCSLAMRGSRRPNKIWTSNWMRGRAAKCEEIFTDTLSGAKTERPGLDDALKFLRVWDTLVVWKLDRLGWSALHLIQIVNDLGKRHVNILFLTDQIDTTTASGRFFFQICASFVELERERIRERTQAGLQAARARGRKGGDPKPSRG